MVYQWKTGYFKTDAKVAGEVFCQLEQTVGLTAKTIVDASRNEDAPLHGEFEWDDAIAGELWREQRARVMIQNLVVRTEEKDDARIVRAFIKLEEASDYESITTILADVEKTTSLLSLALKELQQFQRKYSDLKELAGVFKEIEKVQGLREVS